MDEFLESINNRLDILAEKTKVNEFSGKDINSVKSIMLQITQMKGITGVNRKAVCLDILAQLEEEYK